MPTAIVPEIFMTRLFPRRFQPHGQDGIRNRLVKRAARKNDCCKPRRRRLSTRRLFPSLPHPSLQPTEQRRIRDDRPGIPDEVFDRRFSGTNCNLIRKRNRELLLLQIWGKKTFGKKTKFSPRTRGKDYPHNAARDAWGDGGDAGRRFRSLVPLINRRTFSRASEFDRAEISRRRALQWSVGSTFLIVIILILITRRAQRVRSGSCLGRWYS